MEYDPIMSVNQMRDYLARQFLLAAVRSEGLPDSGVFAHDMVHRAYDLAEAMMDESADCRGWRDAHHSNTNV